MGENGEEDIFEAQLRDKTRRTVGVVSASRCSYRRMTNLQSTPGPTAFRCIITHRQPSYRTEAARR